MGGSLGSVHPLHVVFRASPGLSVPSDQGEDLIRSSGALQQKPGAPLSSEGLSVLRWVPATSADRCTEQRLGPASPAHSTLSPPRPAPMFPPIFSDLPPTPTTFPLSSPLCPHLSLSIPHAGDRPLSRLELSLLRCRDAKRVAPCVAEHQL